MKKITKINKLIIITFTFFGFLFWHFAKDMLQIRSDGWYVGHVNLWGDLVFHLGLINKFLETNQILIINPYFPSDKPNYPIFADYITSQLARFIGIDLALFLITFIVGLLFIYISRNFVLNFIRSEAVVFLTLLIFFFNGGFGFYYFFQDLITSQQSFFEFITSLPREYTNIQEQGYWWINTLLAYFLPQRGFLFAFPLTLTILSLLYLGYKKNKRNFFILAGLLTGVLPLVQVHSLFVILIISASLCPFSITISNFKKKVITNWFIFTAITIAIALPLFSSLSSHADPLQFIRFEPGWTSQENIIWFWFKNLGLFAPILIISLIYLYKKRLLFVLYLPFLFIFIIANIFVFQPWEFDNSKLLVYWYFASCIIVAYYLYDQFFVENFIKKIIGLLILLVIVFSGTIDIFRTFTPVTNYQIFSNTDLKVAKSVKTLTPKNSIFITASNHNHPIPALTGRSTLVGFHGWLWSHGLLYQQREQDIKEIYNGDLDAEKLISKYKINYITVGPHENGEFIINHNYLKQFPQIYLTKGWILYDVSNIWADSNR